MVTNISYNNMIDRLRAFADGHYLIKKFSHGQIDLRYLEQDADYYPWMHVIPGTITPQEGLREYAFDITFSDLTRDKEHEAEYIREAISDCTRLAEDLLAEIKNGNTLFDPFVQIVDGSTITPFIHEDTHTLTGVTLSCSIRVPWNWSACDIPADYAPGGSGSGGSGSGGGILLQVNGVDNVDQGTLDLVQGTNITITDLGNGSVQIDSSGGGGCCNLQDVTDLGNNTTNDINFGPLAGVYFDNGSNVTEGTTDSGLGGNNGVALKCSIAYELKWEAGRLYAMEQDGFTIREVSHCFSQVPSSTEDDTQGFVVGSRWILDDGDVYECTDNTTGAAVWVLQTVAPQVNSDWNSTSGVSEILNKPTLAAVATSGDYNDLSNLPTIPAAQVNSDWNATSGVAQILNKPTIPTSLPPSGNAGGDLTGTYPNPTVHRIHGIDLQSGTPSTDNVWVYGGSPAKWQHQALGADQVNNTSSVTGATVKAALDHLDSTKQATLVSGTNIKTIEGQSLVGAGNIDLSKSDVGLSNVDNTSDANKPISTATQTALNAKEPTITAGTTSQYYRGDKTFVTHDIASITDATDVGKNLVKLTNPSAIRYLRINADNTVDAITSGTLISDLGIATTLVLAKDNSTYQHTGNTTNTLVWSQSVAANTFQTNDLIEWIMQLVTNTPNGTTVTYRIYINTSSSLTGASLLGTLSNSSGTGNAGFQRNIFVTATGSSGNLRVFPTTSSASSSYVAGSLNASNVTVDTTVTQYFIVAIQNGNTTATTSVQGNMIRLTR